MFDVTKLIEVCGEELAQLDTIKASDMEATEREHILQLLSEVIMYKLVANEILPELNEALTKMFTQLIRNILEVALSE